MLDNFISIWLISELIFDTISDIRFADFLSRRLQPAVHFWKILNQKQADCDPHHI